MKRRNEAVMRVMAAAGFMIACAEAAWAARGGPDFDGDGREDLVVPVPYEDISGGTGGGAVHVIYGSGSGPTANGDQLWHQDVDGVNDSVADGEQFGQAVTWGDFDDDGFDDLAIGVPGESVGGNASAGGVAVLYGSAQGLRSNGDQFWTQDSDGIVDTAEEFDRFGRALAAGDFDNDGRDDLAIGVAGEELGGPSEIGAVHVIYGRSSGLSTSGDQLLTQDTAGVPGGGEEDDLFGSALASGDFDGDGRDDLAIGVPLEDNEGLGLNAVGYVNVLYGSGSGLTGTGSQLIWQNDFGTDIAEANDQFGEVLNTGDFDGNGKDDLVIGVWAEDDAANATGEVDVMYGSSNGLNVNNTERWALDGGGGIGDLPGSAAGLDLCGLSVAVGDFDDDGRDDLSIGVPWREVGGLNTVGVVIVLEGGSNGLREGTAKLWHEDKSGMNGSAEAGDAFGFSQTAGDYDGDGRDDLCVGVPGENPGGVDFAGAVHVIFGSNSGLTSSGDKVIHQDTSGIRDTAEVNDEVGNFNGVEIL